ncbi:uncharacterized protein N7500_006762 [Penicillium coprophilum]|uniref:uncharacterized protein n=1 Tax=Penicillium coprophilum TaxID=36646 RepID=UPI00239E39E9|nr:uncharacterized protein N7500_006762 [Penicillium coprophilum]KAJ5164932.1 hypothetical protein N7500_006762 [Penicillium coprophilum]
MADHNTYLKYKRDERQLVYWIIHASAHITKSFPSSLTEGSTPTGAISLSTLKSLSGLIAKHIDPIPTVIFRLFATASDPDPEIQKSNVSHQNWIEGLSEVNWRRAFTINWLYDLVNVSTSIVVQRRTRGQRIQLETVDWSRLGPWNEHRWLFGLHDFAGGITHLAVQKPGTEIKSKILPHHVFELQCIVESLTVSRGWSISVFTGRVLTPAARGFRVRRDVDIFMDRYNKRFGKGFCSSVDVLSQLLDGDALLHRDPTWNKTLKDFMIEFRTDLNNWLGGTKYMHDLTGIPPSRFSNTNSKVCENTVHYFVAPGL